MNRDEAKDILLLYRHHHPADEQDPLIIEALALAKSDPDLARWLEMHCARQFVLREKFRQIPVPAGLKEQIISEHAAGRRALPRRRFALAAALLLTGLFTLAVVWFNQRRPPEDTLLVFQHQMARLALGGYAMDLLTNDEAAIRGYLRAKGSPADYVLSPALGRTGLAGCAVQGWQDRTVSMICFRTGKPLAPGEQSNLWLFIVDQKSVKDAPADSSPHFASVNRLVTATWVRDGKLYYLGLEGGPEDLRKYL